MEWAGQKPKFNFGDKLTIKIDVENRSLNFTKKIPIDVYIYMVEAIMNSDSKNYFRYYFTNEMPCSYSDKGNLTHIMLESELVKMMEES